MMRIWKMLAFVAVTGFGVPSQAVFAQVSGPAESGEAKAVIERLNKMEKALSDKMQESFKFVKADMDSVKKDIEVLQAKNLALNIAMSASDLKIEALQAEIKILGNRLALLEQNLAKLQPSGGYTAKSSPVPALGRVFLVNVQPEDMDFIINQKVYKVRALTQAALESVPAGTLTYEVLSPTRGRSGFTATTLSPGETLTLTAR